MRSGACREGNDVINSASLLPVRLDCFLSSHLFLTPPLISFLPPLILFPSLFFSTLSLSLSFIHESAALINKAKREEGNLFLTLFLSFFVLPSHTAPLDAHYITIENKPS